MRFSALLLASFAAVAGCGSEDNVVLAGYSAVISPVHSSISTQATFTDASGAHPQWVIRHSQVSRLRPQGHGHPGQLQDPNRGLHAHPGLGSTRNDGTLLRRTERPEPPG